MKKKFLSLALALALCAGLLALPASAGEMGRVGEPQIISVGPSQLAAVDADGVLWMCGRNDYGQLGNGSTEDCFTPVKIMEDVTSASCGNLYTAAIKTDGSLWVWGSNSSGQLGDGTYKERTDPVKIMDDVAAVSCGDGHTAAIKTDGSLWVWGANSSGQFGDGTTTVNRPTPVKVMEDVAAVSCGNLYTAVIKSDGSLWMCGRNDLSQLGDAAAVDRATPVKIMDDVAAVSCGASHTAAVQTDGTLWTWGGASGISVLLGYEKGNATINSALGGTYPIQTVPKQVTGLTMPKGLRLNLNGGFGSGVLWADSTDVVKVPTNPTRPGYTCGGWYTDEALTTPWNFNNKVVNVLVLYAKWVPVSSTATTTTQSTQKISLNGMAVNLQGYTLRAANGGDVTYVKLRDVAALLDGSKAQFNVDWRSGAIYVDTGKKYTTRNGTELKAIQGTDGTYRWNTAPVLFNGETRALEGIVITDGNGGGHTFFKLRDLGQALGFNVGWSGDRGVFIETDKPYDPNN